MSSTYAITVVLTFLIIQVNSMLSPFQRATEWDNQPIRNTFLQYEGVRPRNSPMSSYYGFNSDMNQPGQFRPMTNFQMNPSGQQFREKIQAQLINYHKQDQPYSYQMQPEQNYYLLQGQPRRYLEEDQPSSYSMQLQPDIYPEEPQPNIYPDEAELNNYPEEPQPNNYPEEPQPNNYLEEPQPNNYPEEPQPNNYPEELQSNNYPEELQSNNYPEEPQPNNYPTEEQSNQNEGSKMSVNELKEGFWNKISGFKNLLAGKFKGLCKKFTDVYENSQDYMNKLYDEAEKNKEAQIKKDEEETEKCRETSPDEEAFKECIDKYEHTKELFSREKVQLYLSTAKDTLKPIYGVAQQCANYTSE